jgi:RNA polymerase sigma-70 factor, ECF subfamily
MTPSAANPDRDPAFDLKLMGRLKAGDDLALNELMNRWRTPLTSFILRYTGNEQDALDIAQETFVRVFENRARFEPRSKFSTWLFTIATNLCRNQARWRQSHPNVSLDGSAGDDDATLGESIAAPGGLPSDNAERSDLASAVREHIQKLPHDLKAVVLLFEYQELGYAEIAAMLKCSPKAVETRLYRARKILREALARWKL